MSEEFEQLKLQYEESKKKYDELRAQEKAKEENLQNLIRDIKKQYERLSNPAFLEQKIKSESGEWEKIAQTISHTMKGPNNNIVNKISEILSRKNIPADERISMLKNIQAEAKYSNDIINLFDIIRKGNEFKTEAVNLSKLIEALKKSEQRCVDLAWNKSSELRTVNLERILGRSLTDEERESEIDFLPIKNLSSVNVEKEYRLHPTAFAAVIDEFILNMFRHAKSSKKIGSEEYSLVADKPEIFEIELTQHIDRLEIKFRNSSRDPIFKSWQNIINHDKTISLTKKSFGLYLASLFSKGNSHFENITFYELNVPEHADLSEVILTLKEI